MCALVTGVQTCALPIADPRRVLGHPGAVAEAGAAVVAGAGIDFRETVAHVGAPLTRSARAAPAGAGPDGRSRRPDRPSVVSGKSVSGSVDLGGRLHINKKKNNNE